jgi:antitoxin ParD1/3/4
MARGHIFVHSVSAERCQVLTVLATPARVVKEDLDMNVSLTPELERLVNEKVESGLYQTASEVVREALRLLMERDQVRAHLGADVQAGFDQLARGEGRTYDKASVRELGKRIKTKGRVARPRKR